MKKKGNWNSLFHGKAVCLAALTWAGLSLNLDNPEKGQILLNVIASFRSFDLGWILVLPGLYILFWLGNRYAPEQKRWIRALPAGFFGMNMVLGYAFTREGNWTMLLSLREGQLLKTAAVWLSWSAVTDRGLALVYHLLDTVRTGEPAQEGTLPDGKSGFHPLRWYSWLLRKHSFLTPFLTLLILYLPHFLIAYPAMFMGDTWSMIVQGYSELGMTGVDYLDPEKVLRAGVYINQHHPVFYTLCLHGFLRLGQVLFHSLNRGIFLFCLGQAVLMLASFGAAVSALAKRSVAGKYLIGLILYLFLHPQIRNFLFLVTKDGAYTASFLLLMTCYFQLRTGDGSRRRFFLFCLSGLGVILLRNEGKYVLLLSGILMTLADRENRKAILGYTAAVTMLAMGIYQGLYPALGYTKGGTQEALSVPFQQTARYVLEHPEEVTEGERAAINSVLKYDELADSYNPDGADQVKALYRQEVSGLDLLIYLRAWFRMLLKHPETYLRATYANYYEYLYPGEVRISYYEYGWSAWMCEFANAKLQGLGEGFSLPEWNRRFRYVADSLVDAGLFNVPPVSLMMTPALYSWMLIALAFWTVNRQKGSGRRPLLSLMIPSGVMFLVMFAGPTNGYYSRYLLTLTAFLPILILMQMTVRQEAAAGRKWKA